MLLDVEDRSVILDWRRRMISAGTIANPTEFDRKRNHRMVGKLRALARIGGTLARGAA